MSYLMRRDLAKPRLILDEMCRLYGKFASYLRRVLCKTRLIFPRINGPIDDDAGVTAMTMVLRRTRTRTRRKRSRIKRKTTGEEQGKERKKQKAY